MVGVEDRSLGQRGLFLSVMPPTPRDSRVALALIVLSVAVFAALVPFATTPLAPLPAFIPAYQAALMFSDLATAVVIYGQYSILRSRSLLILGTGYLFTALAVVPHTLSFPGLFAPGGLMGAGPQTTVWLYMLWHGGFPLFVMAYAFTRDDDRPVGAPGLVLLATIAATALAVVLFVLLTTVGHALLPTLLLADNSYTGAMRALILGVWGLNLLALATLWRRRLCALDLWLMVAMVAWSCDVGLSAALNEKRFDLGFYWGRFYGLAAAGFVLAMLLLETRAIHARLARSLSDRAVAAERATAESAATLRAVIDASSQAIVALTPDTRVMLWNRTAEAMFGYAADEVLDRSFPLATPGGEAEHTALFARVATGETVRDQMLRCRTKAGAQPDIRGSAAPLHDGAGRLRGMVLAFDDVTEELRTEDMLRQSQKMEAVGQLTGGVAHDFNNILMVILANVEAMQDEEVLSPGQRAHVGRIATSTQRAVELTRQLLAFSRKQRLRPQATDLTELVSNVGALLRRTLGTRIEVEAIFAEGLWTANIDRAQLEAALLNLCVNARDAMPAGGRLLIEAANAELDEVYARQNPGAVPGQYVMLAVSDTGTGMAPDIVAKVFEPFFTTKAVGKGTGLGLSMVYGFIKQSNGHIRVYSEPGHGTTIRLYLPCIAGPSVDSPEQRPMDLPRGREHVLLVEDDAQVRDAVAGQLRSLGYTVTATDGGAEALKMLESGAAFDLMLSDIVMPGLDGPALAALVARRWPAIAIMLMSGYSENAVLGTGEVAPGTQILSKPFRKIDLARRVRERLDRG